MAPSRSALASKPKKIDLQAILRQATNPDAEQRTSVDDILHGLKELNKVRETCAEADAFYFGDVGMVWASEKVRRLLEKQGVEDVKDFNYASIPVDQIANRLQISSVVAAPEEGDGEARGEVEGDTDSEGAGGEADKSVATGNGRAPGRKTPSRRAAAPAERATKAIAELRKSNELDAEEKRLHKDVSRHGTAYLLVWPVRDVRGKVVGVDMRVNSADSVILIYDEEDRLKPRFALKSWTVEVDKKTATRVNLYYPNRIERWTTEPGGNPEKEDAWRKLAAMVDDLEPDEADELTADEFNPDPDAATGRDDAAPLDPDDIPNPWGRVPFFHFRNDRPTGCPEHRNAYGPQQMINKLVLAHAGVIDFQSFPQRYIMVDPMQDDPMQNLDDPDHPDDTDEDVETDTGHSGLRSDPAQVWRLFGKSTGVYQAADPQVFLAPLDRYIRSMAELTGMPQYAFSRSSGDMPSGESVRELNGDLYAKVADRQARYDATWQDSYEFALKMLGITGVTIDVRWAPIERVNDLTGWQVIKAKIEAGVPPQVALEEAGYAPEQVEDWLADATGADLGRRVALLGQIATATQAFGAAVATGAVAAPQVQALITGLFGDLLAGTDIELPEPSKDDYVDPQAALKMQQEAQKAQIDAQRGMQREQLDAADRARKDTQRFQDRQGDKAHERAKDMLGQQQQAGTGGRGPGGNGRAR